MHHPLQLRSADPGRPDATRPAHLPRSGAVAAFGLMLLGALAVAAQTPADEPSSTRWTQIAPGIEAALPAHSARFDDGNSVRIVTADGVVVVDPPTDPAVADRWIERTQAEGRAVRLVVATHWHSDHHQTASRILNAFPQATFVGHRLLQSKIPAEVAADHRARFERLSEQIPAAKTALAEGRGLTGDPLDAEQQEAQRAAIARAETWLDANADVEFAVPSIGVGGTTSLRVGDVQIEARVFRAHTGGDLVLMLPTHGVALTGDLLDDLPFIGHGAPRSWIRVLDEIHHWPVHTFIPGHGAPFGKEHIVKIRAFLADLVDAVDRARADGVDLDTLVQGSAEDPRFASHRDVLARDDAARRFFDGTLAAALRAAWDESS